MPRVGLPKYLLIQLYNSTTGTMNSTDGPGVAAYWASNNRSRADIHLGFDMDGNMHYENSPLKDKVNMQFSIDPTVSCKSGELQFDPSKDGVLRISVSYRHVLL